MGWFDTSRKPKPNVVEEYSIRLFKKAVEGVNAIKQLSEDKCVEGQGRGLTHLEWFSVFNEFQYFYLHLTDRIAFELIDDPDRSKILSELEKLCIDLSVQTICDGWPSEKIEGIKSESMQNFLKSMEQYAQCKEFFAKKGESPKATLFWEFGKQVAGLAGQDMDILFVTCAMESAVAALKELDIKQFIEAVK